MIFLPPLKICADETQAHGSAIRPQDLGMVEAVGISDEQSETVVFHPQGHALRGPHPGQDIPTDTESSSLRRRSGRNWLLPFGPAAATMALWQPNWDSLAAEDHVGWEEHPTNMMKGTH